MITYLLSCMCRRHNWSQLDNRDLQQGRNLHQLKNMWRTANLSDRPAILDQLTPGATSHIIAANGAGGAQFRPVGIAGFSNWWGIGEKPSELYETRHVMSCASLHSGQVKYLISDRASGSFWRSLWLFFSTNQPVDPRVTASHNRVVGEIENVLIVLAHFKPMIKA